MLERCAPRSRKSERLFEHCLAVERHRRSTAGAPLNVCLGDFSNARSAPATTFCLSGTWAKVGTVKKHNNSENTYEVFSTEYSSSTYYWQGFLQYLRSYGSFNSSAKSLHVEMTWELFMTLRSVSTFTTWRVRQGTVNEKRFGMTFK